MKLSEIKGQEAFKAMGTVIGCLRDMFQDKKLSKITTEQKAGWLFDFFTISLEEKSDVWMKMFLALNPDMKEEEVSVGSVIRFAYDFKNDPELMSLFFSQSGRMEKTSIGSHTGNITEIEKK